MTRALPRWAIRGPQKVMNSAASRSLSPRMDSFSSRKPAAEHHRPHQRIGINTAPAGDASPVVRRRLLLL